MTWNSNCNLLVATHKFKLTKMSLTAISFKDHLGRVPFNQNFRKFWFKIEWNRNFPEIRFENFGSPLKVGFLEIWKFRKFPVTFGISTQFKSAPVPLVGESYKMAASLSSQHYTGCKMICHSSSLFLIEDKIVRI